MNHSQIGSPKVALTASRTCLRAIVRACLAATFAATGLAQQPQAPTLTLDEAISQAIAHNASLAKTALETKQAVANLAATKTKRYVSSSISGQGSELLTEPKITFAAGSLGTYPSTGPIPGTDQTITIPRNFTGIVSASATQPVTTQIKLHFQIKGLELGVAETREDERKQRLETVDSVRRAYYAVVEAQSDLDSVQASLPFYRESQRLAMESAERETVLQSDLLRSTAQLLQTENSASEAEDQLVSAVEKLNDLMGRDVHLKFRVAAAADVDDGSDTQETLEARALQNRPDVKKARLDVRKTDYDVRAKKSEYIPDVSGSVSYYTTFNFGSTLPSNITLGGFSLSWEPWDWGRRHQEVIGKRALEDEAKISADSTERSALIEVDTAWRQLQSARRQVALSEANQLTARQRLQEIQEQAKREEKLPKDLFQAQSDLASADSKHEKALTGFWKAHADLKKVTGEE